MKERRWHVYENKGSSLENRGRSGNVIENKAGYAHNAEMSLKRKGVIGNAELLTAGLEGRGFSLAVTRPS
jgi:hypothetical protein